MNQPERYHHLKQAIRNFEPAIAASHPVHSREAQAASVDGVVQKMKDQLLKGLPCGNIDVVACNGEVMSFRIQFMTREARPKPALEVNFYPSVNEEPMGAAAEARMIANAVTAIACFEAIEENREQQEKARKRKEAEDAKKEAPAPAEPASEAEARIMPFPVATPNAADETKE